MYDTKYAAYASIPGIIGGKPTLAKIVRDHPSRQRPALPTLLGCLFVPWLLYSIAFWLRSFDIRRDSDIVASLFCYCLLLPIGAFAYMTSGLSGNGGDPRLMGFLTVTSLTAWIAGFCLGDWSYHSFMRPYYDINDLNVYPNVDAGTYAGQALMDAGMMQFQKGSGLRFDKAIGFKNEDIYCVVPIGGSESNQTTFDFWAVGLNCCSAHVSDFRCGEYTNPGASWGLRLMDASKRDMFRLAVQQATAAYNLQAPHPVFLYWLADPSAEVNAYQHDGLKYFYFTMAAAFAVQLFLVVCATAAIVKIA